mmetsp:Transcript_39417/g.96506  ORF Transcript_39417/g.96506 Transcript_39417/m.96506 type:complete len:108 (-) Transcript_39417:126-449(-)
MRCIFQAWSTSLPKKKGGGSSGAAAADADADDGVEVEEFLSTFSKLYRAAELQGVKKEELPPGVDADNRELSLHEDDFEAVFGVSKDKYFQLPRWKQIAAKKKAKMF